MSILPWRGVAELNCSSGTCQLRAKLVADLLRNQDMFILKYWLEEPFETTLLVGELDSFFPVDS